MNKLEQLKNRDTDRQKVEKWLDHINEHDKATRMEVLENCAKDTSARSYYVKRHNEDCLK